MNFDLSSEATALLFFAGLVAGFVNVMAAGGSLLTMPLMIFLGLPEGAANGTARVAILVQNASALFRYARAGSVDWGLLRRMVLPGVIGAALGALLALRISGQSFRVLLSTVTLICAALLVFPPRASGSQSVRPALTSAARLWPSLLVIGLYGGVVQAGVGYLILLLLTVVMRLSLMQANVLKIGIVSAYMPVTLLIFGQHGWIVPSAAIALSCGQAIGGYGGAALSLHKGSPYIRVALAVVVTLSAIKLITDLWV